jgi:TfoX/Sxy family transcriptional regulator of competence genes
MMYEAMASKQSTVDFILDQIRAAGDVSARKMFGEYAIYCGKKIVGLVCDDRLFVKKTDVGKTYAVRCLEKSPYDGAKPCFLISQKRVDNREWITELIRTTSSELPEPLPKKARPKKAK